ncbi:hypothetical protein QYE76_044283 [Lolium multiflorum]|uniref:Uncharacterized protein n=1 Tax=Lolium multiflorum TaxID=4521 RepID=A0AAD8TIC2_LOLMU|nr:hypothetical protein QYE76_044283 [Lolium multiflorum]
MHTGLTEAMLYIKQEMILGVFPPALSQNAKVYWSKVVQEYNERKLHKPYEMRTDRAEESIKKRWTYIKHENSKFRATVDHVVNHPESGMGMMALNALPLGPPGHKASKADLALEASALALSQALEKIMAKSQVALAKRDEKRRLKKEAFIAICLNLIKDAIEVQRMNVEAKRMDAEAKIRTEDARIVLAGLATMDDTTRAWFQTKRAEICARDA